MSEENFSYWTKVTKTFYPTLFCPIRYFGLAFLCNGWGRLPTYPWLISNRRGAIQIWNLAGLACVSFQKSEAANGGVLQVYLFCSCHEAQIRHGQEAKLFCGTDKILPETLENFQKFCCRTHF